MRLAALLCAASPWVSAPPYEVANTAWAFGQIPSPLHPWWVSLAAAARALEVKDLSLHELVNLLGGFVVCPSDVEAGRPLVVILAREIVGRISVGKEELSMHDRRALNGTMANSRDLPELYELKEQLRVAERFERSEWPGSKDTQGGHTNAKKPEAPIVIRTPGGMRCAQDDEDVDLGSAPEHDGGCGARFWGEAGLSRHSDPQECGDCGHGDFGASHGHGHGNFRFIGGHSHTHGEESPARSPERVLWWANDEQESSSEGEDRGSMKQHGHGRVSCKQSCCPTVQMGTANDSLLRLNAHCNYDGHCVQMRNTFIHVECNHDESEDDCMICKLTRPRARSSDNLELSSLRAAESSPTLRARPHPPSVPPVSLQDAPWDFQSAKTLEPNLPPVGLQDAPWDFKEDKALEDSDDSPPGIFKAAAPPPEARQWQ